MRPAIVFDLDGTLVETAPDLHMVLVEVLAERGLEAPSVAAIRTMIGDGARVMVARALAALGYEPSPSELDDLYERCLAIYTAHPCRASHLFEGVKAALESLRERGFGLAICTNKPQAPSQGLLQALGVAHLFDAVVGGDTLPVRKPEPDHLRAAILQAGGRPDCAVMVGDSRNDLLVARNLGVPCVLVSFGYTPVPASELGADAVIDHFRDLHAALEPLLRPA